MARTNPSAYANISTGNPSTDSMQDRLAQSIGQFAKCPFLNGIEIETDIKAGENVVLHRLGRQYRGRIITDVVGTACNLATVFFDDKRVVFYSDVASHVKLWVY